MANTLAFFFDTSKLNEAEFQDFMKKIFDAQMGTDLGMCKFNLYAAGVPEITHELDKIYYPDMAVPPEEIKR
jgi:hypothetical protein